MGDRDEGDEKEKGKRFKVVDRRRFTAEGEERPDAEVREPPPAPKAPPPPVQSKAPAAAPPPGVGPAQAAPPPANGPQGPQGPKGPGGPPPADEEVPIPFAAFLQSMAQQALMQLGMIPFPSGTRQLDLEGARDTIDVLAMLRVKTRGNLAAEEDRAFEQILYELRMTYLDVAERVAAAGPGGPAAPVR